MADTIALSTLAEVHFQLEYFVRGACRGTGCGRGTEPGHTFDILKSVSASVLRQHSFPRHKLTFRNHLDSRSSTPRHHQGRRHVAAMSPKDQQQLLHQQHLAARARKQRWEEQQQSPLPQQQQLEQETPIGGLPKEESPQEKQRGTKRQRPPGERPLMTREELTYFVQGVLFERHVRGLVGRRIEPTPRPRLPIVPRPPTEAPPAHILMNLEEPQLLRMQQVLRQDSNFQDEEGNQTDEEAETYSDEVREELQEESCGLL